MNKVDVEKRLTNKVSMYDYRANCLVCDATDRAMQIHGDIGYSRHKSFNTSTATPPPPPHGR